MPLPQPSSFDVLRMDFLDLRAVICVAEAGSFHKAAKALSIGQSAVSRRVARLEDLLGVSLFERHPSGARLTHAGTRFVSQMHPVFKDLGVAVETAQTAGIAGNGCLRIGLIASLSKGIVREVIEAFVADHADIDLCLAESDRSNLMTMLCHRTIDAIYLAGEPELGAGDGLKLVEEDIFLAVQADGPLAAYDRLKREDVATSPFVVSAREPGPEIHDYIIRRVSDLGRPANVRRLEFPRFGGRLGSYI